MFCMSVVPFGSSKDLLAFSFSGTLPVISHSVYTPARKPGFSSVFLLSCATVIQSGPAAEPVLIALTAFFTSLSPGYDLDKVLTVCFGCFAFCGHCLLQWWLWASVVPWRGLGSSRGLPWGLCFQTFLCKSLRSPRCRSDIWHQMPCLAPVWQRSFYFVSTFAGDFCISPLSSLPSLSGFLFVFYELLFPSDIWVSLLLSSGPLVPVRWSHSRAFRALHTLLWTPRPLSRLRARSDRGRQFLLHTPRRRFPGWVVSQQWSCPIVPSRIQFSDCLVTILACFALPPLFVPGPLLSLFLLVLACPVQRAESLLSSFSWRCASARYRILLLGGPLSLQRGVAFMSPIWQ